MSLPHRRDNQPIQREARELGEACAVEQAGPREIRPDEGVSEQQPCHQAAGAILSGQPGSGQLNTAAIAAQSPVTRSTWPRLRLFRPSAPGWD